MILLQPSALQIPNETPVHCELQPEPKKGGGGLQPKAGPGKAIRSSVYQEEKVSGNTWPTSAHKLQKTSVLLKTTVFPDFAAFLSKTLVALEY